jgi:ABC-type nitrate/sulfonate/bicarbonate transport system substrate-binding protein
MSTEFPKPTRRDCLLGAGSVMLMTQGPREAFAQSPELAEFRIGCTPATISQHPSVIFERTGIDRKNGWRIQTNPRAAPQALYNDLLTGVYDSIPYGGLNVFANMYNRGAPIKLVQASAVYPFPLVVKTDSGINSVKDLKGRKIGALRSSYAYAYLSAIMRAQGLDIEKDAQVVDAAFLQAPLLLDRGDFDATFFLMEYLIGAEMKTPGRLKALIEPSAEFAKVIGQPEAYLYMAVRDEWLTRNRELMPKVMAGYKHLGEFASSNPKEVAAHLAKPVAEGGIELAPEVGTAMYAGFKGMKVKWTSRPVAEIRDALNRELQLYMDLKMIEKLPDDRFFFA